MALTAKEARAAAEAAKVFPVGRGTDWIAKVNGKEFL
jgi:hypothetical protein